MSSMNAAAAAGTPGRPSVAESFAAISWGASFLKQLSGMVSSSFKYSGVPTTWVIDMITKSFDHHESLSTSPKKVSSSLIQSLQLWSLSLSPAARGGLEGAEVRSVATRQSRAHKPPHAEAEKKLDRGAWVSRSLKKSNEDFPCSSAVLSLP